MSKRARDQSVCIPSCCEPAVEAPDVSALVALLEDGTTAVRQVQQVLHEKGWHVRYSVAHNVARRMVRRSTRGKAAAVEAEVAAADVAGLLDAQTCDELLYGHDGLFDESFGADEIADMLYPSAQVIGLRWRM